MHVRMRIIKIFKNEESETMKKIKIKKMKKIKIKNMKKIKIKNIVCDGLNRLILGLLKVS